MVPEFIESSVQDTNGSAVCRFLATCTVDTDIFHLNFAGTHVCVLATSEAASDLLEKHSSTYSGRPQQTMACELMGWDFSLALVPYDYPESLVSNLRRMAGETIMSIPYGLDVLPKNDPYIDTAEES
ncbi:unnamed protein product [Cyclocybe aegerita]|uniref:Uncharacterized protein n=1 Tax=Cyclocybe aegerita TaxID=1973307 RepID=A0A8S0WXB8_CYCAE|nr:unnamed protein product [Cyclocybe aegerita]